jgi:hypothetical protein
MATPITHIAFCLEGAFLQIAASPVKVDTPLVVIVELSQPPRPLQVTVTGPKLPLAVDVKKPVLLPVIVVGVSWRVVGVT